MTDKFTSKGKYRIYPIFKDESEFFALQNKPVNGGVSLDICTGSGIHAIFSVINGALRAYASDINPRAETFVKLNAALNGLLNLNNK